MATRKKNEDNPFDDDPKQEPVTVETAADLRQLFRHDITGMQVPMTGTNPVFKNKYYKIDDILAAIKRDLEPKGWRLDRYVTEGWEVIGDEVYFVATLSHAWRNLNYPDLAILNESSDKWIWPLSKFDDQKFAGHLTYYWRRKLSLTFNLSDEDVDGNNAITAEPKSTPAKKTLKDEVQFGTPSKFQPGGKK